MMATCKVKKAEAPVVVSFMDFVNDDADSKSMKQASIMKHKNSKQKQTDREKKQPAQYGIQLQKRKHNGSPFDNNKPSKRKKSDENDVVFIGSVSKSKQTESKISKSKPNLGNTVKKAKKSKRRRSSTDVIEIKVIKPPQPNLVGPKSSSTSSQNHLSNFVQEETPLWVEKHKPSSPSNLLVNQRMINKLQLWLQQWKLIIKKETVSLQRQAEKEQNKKKKKSNGSSSDSDFQLSEEDSRDVGIPNTFVLIGPTGCGKTVTAHTCASAVGFKVLEINASCHRSYKQIMSQLQEATQSHLIWKQSNKETTNMKSNLGKNSSCKSVEGFFRKQSFTSQPKAQSAVKDQNSLILFDEVEAILECDKGFWSAVQSFSNMTKRPILLTATNTSVLDNLTGNFITAKLSSASKQKLCDLIQSIGVKEEIALDAKDCEQMVSCLQCDIRQAVMSLQFWTQSELSKAKSVSPKTNRQSKSSKRRSSSASTLTCGVNKITAKVWGTQDILHSSKPVHDHFTETKGSCLKSLEDSLSHLLALKLPNIILQKRFELVGAEPQDSPSSSLVIHVQNDTFPTSEQQMFGQTHPDIDSDFLSLAYNRPLMPTSSMPFACSEDSLESNKSTSMPPPVPKNDNEIPNCNESYSNAQLRDLSEYFDMISMCDQFDHRYVDRYPCLSCDAGEARLLDGLSDNIVTKVCEPPASVARVFVELQASLHVRSLHKAQNKIRHQPVPLKPLPSASIDSNRYSKELFERLSFCSDAKPFPNACRSFNLDYLPALRSVCRTEEKRKVAKTSRRFFHYFDHIQLFAPPGDLAKLAGEFVEQIVVDKNN